ncbi:MAG: hypothetical protein U1A16_03905 [Patescibacteria group bacterium]|nr:hypothetical protein [Patescibacteria group bacterium]
MANGNGGIGTTNPGARPEVHGALRPNTTNAQPTCSAATRGVPWFTPGGNNVKDTLEVCSKNADAAYT